MVGWWRFLLICLGLVTFGVASEDPSETWTAYHDEQGLLDSLNRIAAAHPTIAQVFRLGTSAGNRAIWGIHISDYVRLNKRERGEPAIKLLANLHGDEVVGRELLIRLAHDLTSLHGTTTTEYGRRATHIVNGVDLYLVPCANPDGFASRSRGNANGKDLNRDFPDPWTKGGDSETFVGRQAETVAIMNWTMTGPQFVLAAGFHGGAVVANYPWDGNAQHHSGQYTATPDDAMFTSLAKLYATTHATMHKSKEFPGGITNGAKWYVLYHGMQDWDYVWHGIMDITVELSEDKWPDGATLVDEWELNRPAIYKYLEVPLWCGVHGLVMNKYTGTAVTTGCVVSVTQVGKSVGTDRFTGEFWRLLPPGEYDVQATAPGYQPSGPIHFVIPPTAYQVAPVELNIRLEPL